MSWAAYIRLSNRTSGGPPLPQTIILQKQLSLLERTGEAHRCAGRARERGNGAYLRRWVLAESTEFLTFGLLPNLSLTLTTNLTSDLLSD